MIGFGFSVFTQAILGAVGWFKNASLNLDFTSGVLDPRVTFSRTTNATLTNSAGLVAYAPHNLLTYSEQFDNAAWSKSGATVAANAVTAPDGTLTADAVVEDTSSSTHRVFQSPSVQALLYTHSCYVKKAGRDWFYFDSTDINLNRRQVYFNLATGVVGTIGAGWTNVSITPVGGGWYRCSASLSMASGVNLMICGFAPTDGATVYIGNGSIAGYFWGAQLNLGPLQDYNPTTVKNLLGFTGNFDNAAWTKSNASITSGFSDIYGQPFAQKLVEDTATAFHRISPLAATVVSGSTITTSVYAKAAERTGLGLFPYSSAAGARFNLANGTVISQEAGVTASITNVGNGWYRCAASIVTPGTSAAPWILPLGPSNATNYTGDGTSGIYIFGAQLSDSASVDPYVYNPVAAPTAQAYYGPRFDYDPVTLAPKGLLIEEQRTNLCVRSSEINSNLYSSIWQFTFGSDQWIPSGKITAPDGTSSAQTYTTVAGATAYTGYQQMTVSANTVYTWSMYVRLGTLPLGDFKIAFRDDTAGVFIAQDVTPTLVSVGGGWSRLIYTLTTPAGCVLLRCYPIRSTSISVGGTISFWGAQLEAGAFATSYIPTVASQVTRAADIATMIGTNFSSWYNQNEGTLFADAVVPPNLSAFPTVATISDGSTNNHTSHYVFTSGTYANVRSGGVVQGDLGRLFTLPTGINYKFAVALGSNQGRAAANGVIGTLITPLTMPVNVNQMRIGANATGGAVSNTHIRRIAYYSRRLTDAELQGITA